MELSIAIRWEETDVVKLEIRKNTYYDSVTLMIISKDVKNLSGVSEALVGMGQKTYTRPRIISVSLRTYGTVTQQPTRERTGMELRFEHGNFDDARIVRTRVFMEEQGFQDEFDDIDDDPRTIHVTLYDANALVGCARTFPDPDRPDQPGRWVFGRLAVLPEARRGGFGAALLAESERLAREAGATEMHLHAQCRVTPFYGRMGYAQYGPVELDEHVEHIWMEKLLDETGGRG